MTTIASRLQAVHRRIDAALAAADRVPGEVMLIAVGKTFPAEAIVEAVRAGQRAFGENYAQEAVQKIAAVEALLAATAAATAPLRPAEWRGGRADARPPRSSPQCGDDSRRDDAVASGHSSGVASPHAGPLLRPPECGDDSHREEAVASGHSSGVASPHAGPLLSPPEWHFIGPVQSNKTRVIAELFSWVHSVDRLKIAQRLSDARPAALPPLNVCLQVNVSGEASKSGVSPSAALPLALDVARLPRLRLRGLMAIPEPTADAALQRRRFAAVRELRDEIVAAGLPLDTLSMGMSDDLEAAIAEGATIVRIGRAIFGERTAPAQR
jgi:PLP dependent protein